MPRLYHSAATLLPDGRVLSTGGNGHPTPEAFSPPYLFKGPRPTLTAVPSTIGYGQSFSVQSPDARANITKVTLIRITSVTHAFNQNQRLSVLSFTPGPGALDIVAPANANIAPPGHYLLFIVDGSGVPSIGSIVQLVAGPAPPPPATLTGLSPSSAAAGAPGFTLTVNGTGFVSGASVRWNGADRTTTFVNSAQLTAAIPASDIAAAGTAQVTVVNPGAVASNALPFTVTALPRPAPAGDADRALAEQRGGRRSGVHAHRDRHGLRVRGERPVEWRGPDDDVREQRSADRRDSRGRHRRGRHGAGHGGESGRSRIKRVAVHGHGPARRPRRRR